EREASQRAAYLAVACRGDEALRREVEMLISGHEQAGDFIETPAFEVAAAVLSEERRQLHAGQEIGPYRIVAPLGAGGVGEVYLAEDKRLDRKLALKLLPAEFTKDEKRLRRFEQEARAASALNHPNIITIYEIGRVDDLHYIATEFVAGQTLRQQMTQIRMKL